MRLATIDRVELGNVVTLWRNPDGNSGQGGIVTAFDEDSVTLESGSGHVVNEMAWNDIHHITVDEALDASECLNFGDDCSGAVDYRTTGSSHRAWPRCEFHAALRQKSYENSSERYANSDAAPSSFKRSWGGENEYGEHWSEDDY